MILYTSKKEKFYNLSIFEYNLEDLRKKGYANKIYINLTNQCPCACTFCLRNTKEMDASGSLWLKHEPTGEEVIAELKKYNWESVDEIVFCGFGEPMMRLEVILQVCKFIKRISDTMPIRINTNGLANLIHHEDVTCHLKGLIDTISISLNASTAEKYNDITRSQYGIQSFNAMLSFALQCKKSVPKVILTVVDIIGVKEIDACIRLCRELNLDLRIRTMEY